MSNWEIAAHAVGILPEGIGWEPFSVGTVEGVEGAVVQAIWWRRHQKAALEHLLKTSEVARLVGMHPASITKLARAGRLPPYFKVGGAFRWKKSDIEDYLAKRELEWNKAIVKG